MTREELEKDWPRAARWLTIGLQYVHDQALLELVFEECDRNVRQPSAEPWEYIESVLNSARQAYEEEYAGMTNLREAAEEASK